MIKMVDVTYYWTAYDFSYWNNPGNMTDGSTRTFADATIQFTQQLNTTNTCNGTNLGTITKVEIRAYGYVDSPFTPIKIFLFICLGGICLDEYVWRSLPAPAWSEYFDITFAGIAPTPWTWNDIRSLGVVVMSGSEFYSAVYCGRVEVRVTYTPPVSVAGKGLVSWTP